MPVPPLNCQLVLANVFLNARLRLTILEARLLTAVLVRLPQPAAGFEEVRVPLAEVVAPSGRVMSEDDYDTIRELVLRLPERMLELAPPSAAELSGCCLLVFEYVRYHKSCAFLRVKLHDALLPHLMRSEFGYTSAPAAQLRKLKAVAAHRLYWWLREYAATGERTMEISELKWQLDLLGKYKNVSLFIERVIEPAQRELANTDLAFETKPVMRGLRLHALHFIFPPLVRPLPVVSPAASESEEEWFTGRLGLFIGLTVRVVTALAAAKYGHG